MTAPLDLDAIERNVNYQSVGINHLREDVRALIAELRQTRAERDSAIAANSQPNQSARERDAYATLLADQEPLGKEFERVLHENLRNLYSRSNPDRIHTSDGHSLGDGATVAAERGDRKKPTIAELEEILSSKGGEVRIAPNGEIYAIRDETEIRTAAHLQGWQQAIEAAAKCIEDGRFLSEDSPIHREAKSLARAIRALTPPPEETPQ